MIELLIALVIVIVVLAAAFMSFNRLFQGFKSQTKISESQISSIIGMELLRKDVEMAGFGLPLNCTGITFQEATTSPASTYNDAGNSSNVKPFELGDDAGSGSSDYLVIRSAFNPFDDETEKWAYFVGNSSMSGLSPCPLTITTGGASSFATNTNVVVEDGEAEAKTIQKKASNWKFQISSSNKLDKCPDSLTDYHFYMVYGIDSDNDSNPNITMPFNRVDYYLGTPSDGLPVKCASSTYELYRAQINQSDGKTNPQPILDCVRNLQVSFGKFNNSTSTMSWGGLPSYALDQKHQIREVRVFILYQKGNRERTAVSSGTITLGDNDTGSLATFTPSGDDSYYHWRVRELAFKPMNLGR